MERIYSHGQHIPLSVCDLNTKFNDRCCADWSKTNLIALVTLEGIYILRPQLELPHGPFQIELIRNPQVKFRHQSMCDDWPRFDKMWPHLDNQQYMEIYLDPALMTNIDTISMDFYPRRYRLAKWSPPTRSHPRQCLLAAITIDYQLLIFARDRGAWIAKADVSAEYDKLWYQLNQNNRQTKQQHDEKDFVKLSRDLHSLSICNVCWKETDNHNKLILFSATITGDILVWHVSQSNDEQTTETKLILNVETIIRTKLQYITSIQLFKTLLIASARDGQVVLYDLSVNFKNLDSNEYTQTPAVNNNNQQAPPTSVRTLSLILVEPTATLWHKDYIEVSDFYLQPISQETFRIVLAKSTNICWCNINYTKKSDSDYATLAISDSFSAIDGLDPDVSLHQTPAISLKPAGDRRAVLIADDGSFFQLEFMDDMQDSSPEFNAIRTGKVDMSRMVPRGLCTSPNQILVAMISGISLIYEPSKILAPAKLLLLPLNTDRQFFLDCFHKLTSEEWLKANNVTSPMDVCDYIDYIRSLYSTFNAETGQEFRLTLIKIIQESHRPQNIHQLTRLKIVFFLFMKLVKMKPLFMCDKVSLDIDLYRKQCDKILIYELEQTIDLLSNSPPSRDFNALEINSLRNFLKWLDLSECIDLTCKSRCFDKLSFVKENSLPHESCPICSSEIKLLDGLATCQNEHSFVRCSRSLLLLDLQSAGKFSCEHCNRSYMTHQLWPTTSSWLCLYCQ